MLPTLIELKINTALKAEKLKVQNLSKSPLRALEVYELKIKGLG